MTRRHGSKHGIDRREYELRIREFVKRGTELPHARLTEEVVREIRRRPYAMTAREWAARTGVSLSAIERARAGYTWGHVR